MLSPTPDSIAPIVAYRAWGYTFDDLRGALHPFSGVCNDDAFGWSGAGDRWVAASCQMLELEVIDDEHRVPDEHCSCGFYSVKELSTLRQMFSYRASVHVLGRIELAGKIIEHEVGYRAERARIVELIPWRGTEGIVGRLAACLGVGMGDPIPALSTMPPDRPSSPRRCLRDWVRTPIADCLASPATYRAA